MLTTRWGPTLDEDPVGKPAEVRHLTSIRANVDPDGANSTFAVKTTDEPAFSLEIPLTQIGQVMHEVRFASSLMVNRQRRQHDRGAGMLLELIETAMHPQSIEVLIDAKTGDRIFIFQFSDHSPLTVRVSAQQSATMLERLAREVSRTAN